MKPVALAAFSFALVSCDADLRPLPKLKQSWTVEVSVVDAQSRAPVKNQAVSVHRFQRDRFLCIDCDIEVIDFTLLTDEEGKLAFSSDLSGQWGVAVHEPPQVLCAESASLGLVSSGIKEVVLELGREPCRVVL